MEELDQIIEEAQRLLGRIRTLAAKRDGQGLEERYVLPNIERRRLNGVAEDWSVDLKKLRNMRERSERW